MNAMTVDYTDLDQVIAVAKSLGKRCIVYKDPDRENYNITHIDHRDIWNKPGNVVMYPKSALDRLTD